MASFLLTVTSALLQLITLTCASPPSPLPVGGRRADVWVAVGRCRPCRDVSYATVWGVTQAPASNVQNPSLYSPSLFTVRCHRLTSRETLLSRCKAGGTEQGMHGPWSMCSCILSAGSKTPLNLVDVAAWQPVRPHPPPPSVRA